MLTRALDTAIAFFSPTWGVQRLAARATLQQIDRLTGGQGGYNAGQLNRFTKGQSSTSLKEHAIPFEQASRLRALAWDLYRNNPYARKIVRAIESQVIGKGLRPASAAVLPDGSPDTVFRERAAALWAGLQKGFDYRGMPGQGGLSLVGMQRMALRAIVLGGEVLWQERPIDETEQQRRALPVPLTFQLVDAERLADELTNVPLPDGHTLERGIEFDATGRRVAYHLHDYQPGLLAPSLERLRRVDARRIIHTFVEEDVDQWRGISWFAPCLLQVRDCADYQYNELKAAAMAACVVLGYKRPTGKQRFGLQTPTQADSTDDDGNPTTFIQPGMFVDLGTDGKLEGFNPMRPGSNAEAFIQHLLRGAAAGFPGVKSSTVTGDYRNSSFSSERSADNDAWPELEGVQDWFAAQALQPVWERVIEAAVLAGWFRGLTAAKFLANRTNYLACTWQGPVARSINPTDDADAARGRIAAGQSSPQMEAAGLGRNWREILKEVSEYYSEAKKLGIPEEFVNQVLSVDAKDVIAAQAAAQPAATKPAAKKAPARTGTADPPEIEEEDEDEIAVIGMEAANA